MLNTFTLKNGLKIATYTIPQMRSVFLSLSVKGGSIFDAPGKSGAAHFMEHILFQGTPSFPNVEVFSDYIESLAGSYNASTHIQSIRFFITVPNLYLSEVLKIGSEIFFEPLFPLEAIERERNVILAEVKERQDSLWYKNSKFFGKTRYKPNHPLLRDGGGTIESVKKLQKKDLVDYWKQFFYPKNTYLTLVGGFEFSEAKKQLEEYFGKYEPGQEFPGFPEFTNKDLSDKALAIRHDPKLGTCYVSLSFASVWNELPLEEVIPQSIIRSILGGLRGSRLYRLLRQKRGLVYDVGFGAAVYQKFGYGAVDTQVSVEHLDEVLELILKELKVFAQNGPTKEEVEFAKNYHINRILMSFDHPSGIADWIEGDLVWEDKIYTPEEYAEIVRKIDVTRINEFIAKYWDFSKLNLVIQGPIENSKTNREKYSKLLEMVK